ncbi:hypothetical protein, partial [Flavobacterium sp.]|uniref:hypothetical protein n=1 Tax=Flavobacterium sp. TaxID=239 RepID=UPI002489D560
MRNLYFNSIIKKFSCVTVLLVILLGISNSVSAQLKVPFTSRTSQYSPTQQIYNVKGDFVMLGNTNLTLQNYGATTPNNNNVMVYVDVDGNSIAGLGGSPTFNSSSATLSFSSENGANPACSNIVYAGLYWTGRAEQSNTATNTFNVTKTINGTSYTKAFDKRKIMFKGPGTSAYTEFTAAASDIFYPTTSSDGDYIYSAYKEVTDYVRLHGIGEYLAADIALRDGNGGGTGYSGGWGLVVVYENSKMKYRDVNIFDGHAFVVSTNSTGFDLPVSGFNTVRTGEVGVKLGLMASEGDVNLTGDYFRIRNLNTTSYTTLSRAANGLVPNPDNFFNSSISTGGNSRNPTLGNNTGIDITMFNIPNTNNAVIGNQQTATNFRYGTGGDTYAIFAIAMSVDAYVPEAEGILTTTTINNQPAVQPYTILPNQEAGFTIDVRNLGSEAINNYKVIVPLPYNATYVAGSATGTIFYNNPNTTITGTYDPNLGVTGSIVWDFGTLPLPANPTTLLARLSFKIKATNNCEILANASCSSVMAVNGNSTGLGSITNVPLKNSNLIQGYTQNGTCVGQAIPSPINIGINGTSFVEQNCPGTNIVRNFSYCSSSTTVLPSQIASNFPLGSLFYDSFPVTGSSIQYTETLPIPLVAGSTLTYYAVPSGGGSGCRFPFTISKCPTIIAQNDALTGGNGTTGNTNAGNVLNNNGSGVDTLNGVQATIAQVNINVTTPAVSIGGALVPVINTTTGVVSVPAGTPAGTYTITYNLCEKLNPLTNCDPAIVTITVTAPSITAVNDTYTGVNCTTSGVIGNIFTNDTLNGGSFTANQVNFTLLTGSNPNITIGSNGDVNITSGIAAGTYTFTYKICQTINPTNCSNTATISISVNQSPLPTMTAPAAITVACGAITSSTIPYTNGLTGACAITGTSNASTFTATPNACGGTVTETWTATDSYGRTITSVSRIITVSPAALPTMTAPAAITVACGSIPSASTISFSNGLTGSCAINGTSNPSTFTATPNSCGGTVTETWTATDSCGRALASVSRTITVSPAALPTMTAPATITVACGSVPAASTISFSNGLTGSCAITGTSNPSTFSTTTSACGGTVTETWTATDSCGRALASVSRTITVSPAALPTMTAPAAITVACGSVPASSTISFSNGLTGACAITGTSNTSTFSTTTSACGGTVTETWTATDSCGRALESVSRIITVSPAALPTMTAPAAITVACGSVPASSTISFSNGLTGACAITGTSNTSTFSATPSACGGTVTETWTATDSCGRALASVSRIITVSPTDLPTMSAPASITVACGSVPASSTISFS